MMEKTFSDIYENVFKLMKATFKGSSESALIKEYEKDIINKGKANPKYIHTLNKLIAVKKDYKNKKAPGKYEFETLRRDSVYLVESLIEYTQRKDLGLIEKTKVTLSFNDKHADLFLTKPAFLIEGEKIRKIEGDKLLESNANEFNQTLANNKGGRVLLSKELMAVLSKELGEFDVSL